MCFLNIQVQYASLLRDQRVFLLIAYVCNCGVATAGWNGVIACGDVVTAARSTSTPAVAYNQKVFRSAALHAEAEKMMSHSKRRITSRENALFDIFGRGRRPTWSFIWSLIRLPKIGLIIRLTIIESSTVLVRWTLQNVFLTYTTRRHTKSGGSVDGEKNHKMGDARSEHVLKSLTRVMTTKSFIVTEHDWMIMSMFFTGNSMMTKHTKTSPPSTRYRLVASSWSSSTNMKSEPGLSAALTQWDNYCT